MKLYFVQARWSQQTQHDDKQSRIKNQERYKLLNTWKILKTVEKWSKRPKLGDQCQLTGNH